MFRLAHLFDLTGRTALVTGGNSGIGFAMARALGLAGADLVLVARRQPELESAAAELRRDAITVEAIAADLAEADGPDRVSEGVSGLARDIDILVNAAGINLRQPFESVTNEAFDRHLAIHLRAPFRLTQLLAPGMAERRWAASSISPPCSPSGPFRIRHHTGRPKAASFS